MQKCPTRTAVKIKVLRVGGKEGMAGEMEPAEDMDQTEPDSTVCFNN